MAKSIVFENDGCKVTAAEIRRAEGRRQLKAAALAEVKNDINTDYIVKLVTARFRTFGGGQTSEFNPLVNMLKDKEPQFAAGVDVREVVDYIVGATLRQV